MIVHIFGGAGSGTSTLGRAVAAEYGCFFMDTDDYFWMPTDPPFREKRPREERLSMLREEFAAHSRALHDEWQEKLACPVVLLDGSQPVKRLIRQLGPYL